MKDCFKNQILNEDLEYIFKSLNDKQKKIEEINKKDEDFDACYKKIKQKYGIENLEDLNTLNMKEARKLQEVVDEIRKILREIYELEKKNGEKVKEILSNLSGEIKKINQGKKVSNVYGSDFESSASSYFIDQKK